MIPVNPDSPADRDGLPEGSAPPADSGTAAATKAERHTERVRSMRRHWRAEAHAHAAGDGTAAERVKRNGDRFFNELIDDLSGSLSHLADAYLHDPDLTEDGVRELIVALYAKLRSLADTPSAHGWESPQTFWQSLRRLASNLFLRRVQKHYGRERVKEAADPDEDGDSTVKVPRPYRETRQSDRPETSEGSADTPDPESQSALHALMDSDALSSLLAAIADPRHRRALLWDAAGVPHEEIRQRLEVKSLKTVYNYIERARSDALAWAKARRSATGEYGDWLDRSRSEEAPGGSGGPRRRPV